MLQLFKRGDIVHYYNHDQGQFLVDHGVVKGENMYTDGVQVYGDGWQQYVGKWFICKVIRNGEVIFEQQESQLSRNIFA